MRQWLHYCGGWWEMQCFDHAELVTEFYFPLSSQAVNPCLRHGFKACRGLRPRTPGCIPTLVLAALHPNISVGCAAS